MSFPRYPKYKDSGADWLGQVPEHWNLGRLGFLCEKIGSGKTPLGGSETYKDDGVAFLRSQNIYDDGLRLDDVVYISDATDEEMSNSRVVAGDILLNITGASIGRTCLVPQGLVCGNVNQHVCIIRLADSKPKEYVAMFLKSAVVKGQIDVIQTGAAREGLNYAQISKLAIALPPNSEQTAIAAFLDRETAKIDGLVAEQRRLIELLKEKRQAVISHAVTKGLNPNAPMKPSGIEWLGDVPEHWEVLKGSRIGVLFGSEQVPEESVREDGDLPFIKVGSMSANSLAIASWDWFVDREVAGQYRPQSDYLVFPKRGAAIFMNKVNIVRRPSLIDPNLMGWKIGTRAIPEYIAYLLQLRRLEELADVSTVPQINNKHIAPERFPIPPVDEQRAIVVTVEARSKEIDTLTAEAERAIGLLQERRTALISAAVTGKIDVRGLAVKGAA